MNRCFIKTSFAKILLLLFAVTLTAKEPICTWTSADGRTLGIFASTASESNYGNMEESLFL